MRETVGARTEDEQRKEKQNMDEEKQFAKSLKKLLKGDVRVASRPLIIGKTTNALAICGADENLELTITKKVIDKAMRPEVRDKKGKLDGKTGHGLSDSQIKKALNELKNPALIFKGSQESSLLVVTSIKDEIERNVVVAVKLNKKENFQTVNSVRSPYGRDNLDWFINDNIEKGNLLAVNIEKANELLRSIEKSYLKENTFISFDNSIAYSLRSVKFPVKEDSVK